ncbi:MAG TPA: glycoside hydrolase family 97 protein [Cytophagaceae bacterium]
MKSGLICYFKSAWRWTQLLSLILIFHSCKINNSEGVASETNPTVSSPGNINTVHFFLDKNGTPHYLVKHKDKVVIDTSSMGFEFQGQKPMNTGFVIKGTSKNAFNETWEMPWGEQRKVVNNYKELVVQLEEAEAPNRPLNIYFRAYDDGIGFRYEFPEQAGVDTIIIMEENTQFQLTGDHMSWWTPGDWDTYELPYQTSRLSEIDALKFKKNDLANSHIKNNAVTTPFTLRTEDGIHMSFHEANLIDYAGMTLKVGDKNYLMQSELVGSDRLGYKVKRSLPFVTPWRTIQIAEKATALIESRLIENLCEPNKIGDVSWFKPKKYVGIWWEMHIDKATWDYKSGRHGATTQNAKRYIDFAAANGIKGVLIEGWNTGWEHWIGFEDREGVFDFVTPYPDYDLKEVVRYGKEKGVEVIMHHETSAAPRTYEKQLDTAYALMKSLGIHSVKTGYVGPIIPKGEYHDGQWMVNHFQRVVEKGAAYKVAINVHEPIKPTGLRRTYPNLISAEGVRGQEFNAWASDGGNPPEHISIVAFTRMLAGPIDYTPGIFDITLPTKPNNQVNSTLAQQLALYVVIYSPIQMAADLPENYEGNPAFQFIRDVGVDWEQTKVLNGEVGDFVTIAREERGTGNWFVGGITDENEREMTISFDFLEEGKKYEAIIYRDSQNAHFKDNPTAIDIVKKEVDNTSSETIKLAKGGGFAISLKPVK